MDPALPLIQACVSYYEEEWAARYVQSSQRVTYTTACTRHQPAADGADDPTRLRHELRTAGKRKAVVEWQRPKIQPGTGRSATFSWQRCTAGFPPSLFHVLLDTLEEK